MMQNKIKQFAILIFTVTLSIALFATSRPATKAADDETTPVNYSDTAATYKAKCNLCHKPAAEKGFDITKTDEQLVEVVLTGKKMAKPPHMPAYNGKGMNAEQAKAFVTYMRQLRATAPKTVQ
jgi:mono/diheme cytochrome c family protein